MTLAVMLSVDKDLLVCDMAETYHVMDIRALSVETLAVLACGLREDSRIRMKMVGVQRVPPEILLAKCADALNMILYVLGADGKAPKPERIIDIIIETEKESAGFESGADFEAEWRRLIGAE